jgi:hypothetical protein
MDASAGSQLGISIDRQPHLLVCPIICISVVRRREHKREQRMLVVAAAAPNLQQLSIAGPARVHRLVAP